MTTMEELRLAFQAVEDSVAAVRRIVGELRQEGVFLGTASAIEDELERALSQEVQCV